MRRQGVDRIRPRAPTTSAREGFGIAAAGIPQAALGKLLTSARGALLACDTF